MIYYVTDNIVRLLYYMNFPEDILGLSYKSPAEDVQRELLCGKLHLHGHKKIAITRF